MPQWVFFINENNLFFYLQQIQYQQVKQECDSIWARHALAQAQAQAQAQALAQMKTLQAQVQNRGYDYEGVKCTRAMPRSAWHSPIQVKNQNNPVYFNGSGLRTGFQSGSGVKRGCGGTGVFLPRPHGTPLPESRKKTSKISYVYFNCFYLWCFGFYFVLLSFCFVFTLGCAPVLVPAKVIHALNLNIDDFNGPRQPRFSNDYGEFVYNEKMN